MSAAAFLLAVTATLGAWQAPNTASRQAADQKGRAPIVVEVVSVDVGANTLVVREPDEVPARAGRAVEVTLTLSSSAIGRRLDEIRAGERVAITCEAQSEPALPPAAPVALTECVRVVELRPAPEQ